MEKSQISICKMYHYTTLDTLALILENKTIRFKNLSRQDDPLEKYVKSMDTQNHRWDITRQNYGSYCFVSCWTAEKIESIAMWEMYGDKKQGVRIALPEKMFDESYDINQKGVKSKKLSHEITNKPVQPQMVMVDYDRTDDPKIISDDLSIVMDNLGKHKLPDWAFQDERRFRLYAVKSKETNKEFWFVPQNEINFNNDYNNPIEREYEDFPLDREVLKQIEITVGPNMPNPKRLLLKALLNQHNIKRVSESKFYVRGDDKEITCFFDSPAED